jgi:hypothetical protein
VPLALLLVGTLFLVAAVRGKQDELFVTLKSDFIGPNNFFYWGLAIWMITAVGYYKPLKPLSHAFLTLVFLGLFLSANKHHQDFFTSFMRQIKP